MVTTNIGVARAATVCASITGGKTAEPMPRNVERKVSSLLSMCLRASEARQGDFIGRVSKW
jgi:hypothetical protein